MKLAAVTLVVAVSAAFEAVDDSPPPAPEWLAVLSMTAGSTNSLVAAADRSRASTFALRADGAGLEVTSVVTEIGMLTLKGPASSALWSMEAIAGVEKVIPNVKRKMLPAAPAGLAAMRRLQAVPASQASVAVDDSVSKGDSRTLTDSEPALRPLQWARDAIDAPRALRAGLKGKGARVAVLDTGFYLQHPSIAHYNQKLSRNMVAGETLAFNPAGAGDNPFMDISHGTHVASIIGGADLGGEGTVGVAPEADLVLIKVMSDAGVGDDATILAGIMYAISINADVINMSFGGVLNRNGKADDPHAPGDDSYTRSWVKYMLQLYNRIFEYAYDSGVTVITALDDNSNNYNRDRELLSLYAALPFTIGVAGTGPVYWGLDQSTPLDKFPPYSSNGGRSVIDFSAPGGNDRTALLDPFSKCKFALDNGVTLDMSCFFYDWVLSAGGSRDATFAKAYYGIATRYAWLPGNSMAAPHVAGTAALIIGKRGRSIRPAKLKQYLKWCSDDIGAPKRDSLFGFGRINAGKVVDLEFQ